LPSQQNDETMHMRDATSTMRRQELTSIKDWQLWGEVSFQWAVRQDVRFADQPIHGRKQRGDGFKWCSLRKMVN
jgi:hypothetical protein